jgi:hypothetical protein
MSAAAVRGFDPEALGPLNEPVRRYFTHALAPGAPTDGRVRLAMRGRIDVGVWLRFAASWEGDARSFTWRAAAGPLGLLRVVDRFADGAGSMEVRVRPGIRLVHATHEDVTRSGAGRAAAEAIWAPAALLPEHGVAWRAERDDLVVATFDVPPERPALRLRLADDGAVRAAEVLRWDDGSHGRRGYVPCGGEVLEERRFGALTIPSRVRIGWWWGTPRYRPFFEAEITAAEPVVG